MKIHQAFLIVLLAICGGNQLQAQIVDYNKVVTPLEQRARDFEAYLVQLAWNNQPDVKILSNELAIAQKEVKLESQEWHNNLTASVNLNEVNLSYVLFWQDQEVQNDLFVPFPIWNIGASLNLGTFTNRPLKKQIAEEKVLVADHRINQKKLNVRALVLERYHSYLNAVEVLKTRTQATDDSYDSYVLSGEKFESGELSFEDFNASSMNYFASKEAQIMAKNDVATSKIKLEELIGISLEEAERRAARFIK